MILPPTSGFSPTARHPRNLARRLAPRWLRNWLRNPFASGRRLYSELRWRCGHVTELDFGAEFGGGLRLRCHPESARTFLLFLDTFENMAELRDFRHAARPGMRLLDLGAHYGFFSLAALAYGGPDARVLAVEPSPAACRMWSRNMALAPAAGRARVINAAAGPHDGTVRMVNAGIASENYMFAATESRPDGDASPQWSLAALAREAGWTPTHVKVDIEGFESELLTASPGNLAALKAWRPTLFLELHCDWIRARGADPAAVLAALDSAGYAPPRWQGLPADIASALAMDCVRLVFSPR